MNVSGVADYFVLENKDSNPEGVSGRLYFNTSDGHIYVFDGISWVKIFGGRPKYFIVGSSTWDGFADVYCDGTDDQVEIQQGIDTVSNKYGGGTVILTPGTYNISDSIALKDKVTIRGFGKEITTITQPDSAGVQHMIKTSSSTDHGIVKDMTINGNQSNNSSTTVNPIYSENISSYGLHETDGSTSTVNMIVDSIFDDEAYAYGSVLNSTFGATLSIAESSKVTVDNSIIYDFNAGSSADVNLANSRVTDQLSGNGSFKISNCYVKSMPQSCFGNYYITNSTVGRLCGEPNYPFGGEISNSIIKGGSPLYIGGGLNHKKSRVTNTHFNFNGILSFTDTEVSGCQFDRVDLWLKNSNLIGSIANAGYFQIDIIQIEPVNSRISGNHFKQNVYLTTAESSPQDVKTAFSNNYVYGYLKIKNLNYLTVSNNFLDSNNTEDLVNLIGSSHILATGNHAYKPNGAGFYLQPNGSYYSTHNVFIGNHVEGGNFGYQEEDANEDYNIIMGNVFIDWDTDSTSIQGANDIVVDNITS